MPELKIEIKGLKELQQAFRQYPKIAEPIYQKAIVASQAVLGKHTLKNDPVPWKTGNLLMSFRFQTGRLFARWFPTAPYALYVNEGTGIFGPKGVPITPTNKQALYWEGAAHPVKSVKGMRPRKYMEKIIGKAQADMDKMFIQALDMVNREIAKRTNVR